MFSVNRPDSCAQEGQALLRLNRMEKSYGKQRVLQIKALTFHQRDRVLICGANGSGKSTLLKLISGVTLPNRGRLIRCPSCLHKKVAYMPQTGGLYMDLSLKDNLSFYADLYDIREHRFTENRHIKKLGLLPFFNKRISELSGGFQRLAAFTAVLSVAPKMLFLDEPFSGIDQSKKELMVSILDELLEDIDLFVITSPNEKKFRLADRILELDKGHIL